MDREALAMGRVWSGCPSSGPRVVWKPSRLDSNGPEGVAGGREWLGGTPGGLGVVGSPPPRGSGVVGRPFQWVRKPSRWVRSPTWGAGMVVRPSWTAGSGWGPSQMAGICREAILALLEGLPTTPGPLGGPPNHCWPSEWAS